MTVTDSPTAAPVPVPALDASRIRQDFPILDPARPGGQLFYLDSAASAQKPRQVLDALRDVYERSYANVHRGVYAIAAEATDRMESARESVRRFLGAATPREIIFTRGTTEAINLVAYSWGRANLGPGDIVLTTKLEHHSNLVPWQQICIQQGAELRFIPIDAQGALDLSGLDALAEGGTLRLVATTHVSNSLGTVVDVRALADWAHARGALILADGAQGMPHRFVDVQALDVDFYAFSGHKALGPSGAGALYGRESVLQGMQPFMFGGEMIRRVDWQETTFNDLPWKFEAGTPAIAELIGMGAALDYLAGLGMDAVHAHERALAGYAWEQLTAVGGVTVLGAIGAEADRGGILSFTMDYAHPHDIASILDQSNVCVRAGHHCTQPLMRELGVTATARASVSVYNTREDIDALIEGLDRVRQTFGPR